MFDPQQRTEQIRYYYDLFIPNCLANISYSLDNILIELMVEEYAKLLGFVRSEVGHDFEDSSFIDIHKIISGTEIAIMNCLCLRSKDKESMGVNNAGDDDATLRLNADFAFNCAILMLQESLQAKFGCRNSNILTRSILNQDFLRDHITLLMNIGSQNNRVLNLPFLFSNSATWYFIDRMCQMDYSSHTNSSEIQPV